jgi:uncharacterized membrane protein
MGDVAHFLSEPACGKKEKRKNALNVPESCIIVFEFDCNYYQSGHKTKATRAICPAILEIDFCCLLAWVPLLFARTSTMGQGAEIAIFTVCITLLVAYNILYFTKSLAWLFIKLSFRGKRYLSLWAVGKESRGVWAAAMMENPEEGITAAQSVRNMVMGCAILAAAITLLAAQLILLLTDPIRLDQIAAYANDDPIAGSRSFMAPQTKLGITLGVFFLSLVAHSQCVRLAVHLTFLLRAASADSKRSKRFQVLAFAINRRTSLYFSLGLRLAYAAFAVFFLVLGVTAFLIATLVEIAALIAMDLIPYRKEYEDAQTDDDLLVEDEHSKVMVERLASRRASTLNTSAFGPATMV